MRNKVKGGSAGPSRRPGRTRPRSSRKDALDALLLSPWPIIVLPLLALALRLIHLDQMSSYGEFRATLLDESRWLDLGRRVAAGNWLLADSPDLVPGYAWFLGLVTRITGPDPAQVRLAQVILGSLVPIPVVQMTRRLLGPAESLFAGLLAAVWTPAIFLSAHLNEATIALLLVAASLAMATRVMEKTTLRAAAGAGLLAGLAIVCQPLCLAAAAMTFMAFTFHRKMKSATKALVLSLFAVFLVAGSGPLAWRHHQLTGQWLPGPAPLKEAAQRGWREENPQGLDLPLSLTGAPAPAGSLIHLADRPGRTLVRLATRIELSLHQTEAPGPFSFDLERRQSWILRLPFPGFATLLPLAMAGLLLLRRGRGRPGLRLLAGVFVILLVAPIPFSCRRDSGS